MSYGAVSVTDTATLIVAANCNRKRVIIANAASAGLVYLGPDSSITVSTAIPLYEYQALQRDKISEDYLGDIYGIANTGETIDVRYWEMT